MNFGSITCQDCGYTAFVNDVLEPRFPGSWVFGICFDNRAMQQSNVNSTAIWSMKV